jgi:hypothetical protein
MRISLLLLLFMVTMSAAFSQAEQPIRVKAGDDPAKSIPPSLRFRYPEFKDGYLYYSVDKKSPSFKMNYNLLFGQLMFIDPRGDTMVVTDEYAVKYIQIGAEFYYHDYPNGYYEIIFGDMNVIMASQQELKMIRRETQGSNGYNKSDPDPTASVSSTRYSSRSPTTNILNEDVIYKKFTAHYLIDQNRKMRKANKAAFKELFPDQEEAIESFVRREDIHFYIEKDILKLLKYCTEQ